MAERLAALPRPELVLLAGLMTGSMEVAAEAWMAAVSVEVQDENNDLEGVIPPDRTDDSANDADGLRTSANHQAEASGSSGSTAVASTVDNARQGEQLGSAAVMAVQSDDGAEAEVRTDGDQPYLPVGGEGNPSREEVLAASTMGEFTGPVPGVSATLTEISASANVADSVKPCSPNVLLNKHCPDNDCPEQSSGSPEADIDGSLHLVSRKPVGSAGAGNLPTTNVPVSASVAPLPLCPKCGSSNTWRIHGARAGRFACMDCHHHFRASTPGDVPATRSQG
jgi:hypothetical protein